MQIYASLLCVPTCHQPNGYIYDTEKIIAEIEKYLKKNAKKIETGKVDKNGNPKNKTAYMLGGIQFENIQIAEFMQKAAKRVQLDKDFDHKKINKIPYSEKSKIPVALHSHLLEYERNKVYPFVRTGNWVI